MNHRLQLSSIDVPELVELRMRVIRTIRLGSTPEASPLNCGRDLGHRLDSGARQLVLTRTVARGVALVGTLTTIGLLVLVLGWGELAQAAAVRRSVWVEGVIVNRDVPHKSFVLAQRGRNPSLILSWDGQTHQWDRSQPTKKGRPVDAAAVVSGRWARVLLQTQANGFLAKRIIFLSANPGPALPAIPPE